jgi:hypothetical protein
MKCRVECSVYESLGLNHPAIFCVALTNVIAPFAQSEEMEISIRKQ